jgi:hypothetical protein
MANTYVFSTGKLLVGDIDATLDPVTNLIGILESVTFTAESSRKDLFAPPAESLYPVATGFYSAKCMLRAENADFNAALLTRVLGMTLSGTTYTATSLSQPTFAQVQFLAADVNGNAITITLYRGLCTSLPLRFTMDDFTKISTEWEGYPSLTQTDATTGDPLVFSIQVG